MLASGQPNIIQISYKATTNAEQQKYFSLETKQTGGKEWKVRDIHAQYAPSMDYYGFVFDCDQIEFVNRIFNSAELVIDIDKNATHTQFSMSQPAMRIIYFVLLLLLLAMFICSSASNSENHGIILLSSSLSLSLFSCCCYVAQSGRSHIGILTRFGQHRRIPKTFPLHANNFCCHFHILAIASHSHHASPFPPSAADML